MIRCLLKRIIYVNNIVYVGYLEFSCYFNSKRTV